MRGTKAFEFVEGGFVGALGGVDAALEADEGGGGNAESLAEGGFIVLAPRSFHFALPDFGVDFGQAAELPIVADEGVEVVTLLGRGGTEAPVVFGGEGGESAGVFATDNLRFGMDAGFEGVHGGRGLALGGAGAGRFLRVEAVGVELFDGCHIFSGHRVAGGKKGSGGGGEEAVCFKLVRII